MSEVVVEFKSVNKLYPSYRIMTMGIKHFLLHPLKAIKEMKSQRFQVLQDVTFTVRRGECVGVIGRNGAGKSTTLGLIAGVLRANSGSVNVYGRVSPLLELGGGFHPELTGRENILLNGVLMGLSRQEVLDKMNSIIEFSELGHFIEQPIRTYSSGMLSRLGFSVVASLEPEILLIDEVLAVGDIRFQKKCLAKMQEFKKQGVTIIFVSHSPMDVKNLCDRVLWFENHRLYKDGDTTGILDRYISEM